MKIGNGEWFLVISLVLFLVVAIWYARAVAVQRREAIKKLNILVLSWIKFEENENRIAENENENSMIYPIHAAKASAYRGCIVDLQRVLYALSPAISQRERHGYPRV